MQNSKKKRWESSAWKRFAVETLKGGVVSVGVAEVIVLAAAGLMRVGLLERGVMEGCVMAAYTLGALVGGMYASRCCTRMKLAAGLGAGVVAFLMFLMGGSVFFGEVSGAGEMWRSLAVCAGGGLAAGVLAATKRGGHKRKR